MFCWTNGWVTISIRLGLSCIFQYNSKVYKCTRLQSNSTHTVSYTHLTFLLCDQTLAFTVENNRWCTINCRHLFDGLPNGYEVIVVSITLWKHRFCCGHLMSSCQFPNKNCYCLLVNWNCINSALISIAGPWSLTQYRPVSYTHLDVYKRQPTYWEMIYCIWILS